MHSVDSTSAHDMPRVSKGMLVFKEASPHQRMASSTLITWESSLFLRWNFIYNYEKPFHISQYTATHNGENDDFTVYH